MDHLSHVTVPSLDCTTEMSTGGRLVDLPDGFVPTTSARAGR